MKVYLVFYDPVEWDSCMELRAVCASEEAAQDRVDALVEKEGKAARHYEIQEWDVEGNVWLVFFDPVEWGREKTLKAVCASEKIAEARRSVLSESHKFSVYEIEEWDVD